MAIKFRIHPAQATSGAYDTAALRLARFGEDEAAAMEAGAAAIEKALLVYYGSQDAVADAYMTHWDLLQDGDRDAERGSDEWGAVWHALTQASPYSYEFEFHGL